MDSKTLKWFREVYECKSISRAAGRLYITPQGLSKSIKGLETELGVMLFDRTANGVTPTAGGKYLYEKSEELMENLQQLQRGMEQIKAQEYGCIRLSSAYGILRLLSPDFILGYQEKYPEGHLEYVEFPDLYVEKEVQNGGADAGFTIGPVDTQIFEVFPLFSLQTSLLVYDTHPLARKEEVDLRELEGVPMVIESDAFKIHHLFIGACREAGFEPNILFCTSGFSLCHKLCAQKRGCSLVVNEISSDMRAAGLKKVKLRQNIPWEAVMICRKEESHFPQVQRLRRYTGEYLRKIRIGKKDVDF